jgi:hypothetical protein
MGVTYALLALALGVFALGVVSEYGKVPRLARVQRWGVGLQLLGLVGAVWVLRPGAGTHRTPEALHGALSSGEPVFVDVFSNY